MATTVDKHYATEDEKRPFVNDDEPFSSKYERMPGAKSSISETIEPFTESQMLRDPRTVIENFNILAISVHFQIVCLQLMMNKPRETIR